MGRSSWTGTSSTRGPEAGEAHCKADGLRLQWVTEAQALRKLDAAAGLAEVTGNSKLGWDCQFPPESREGIVKGGEHRLGHTGRPVPELADSEDSLIPDSHRWHWCYLIGVGKWWDPSRDLRGS